MITLDTITCASSVAIGIGVFIWTLISQLRSNKKLVLENLVVKALAGSLIPTGLVLLGCSFDPSLILKLTGLNMHIAVAGLVLIYVSVKGVKS